MSRDNPVLNALARLFLPWEQRVPLVLQRKTFFLYGAVAFVAVLATYPWNGERPLFFASITQQEVLQEINPYREEQGLALLTVNKKLEQAAHLKAQDMVVRSYFAHEGPDGEPPWAWLEQAGYEYAAAGENLAMNFASADALVLAWMNSSAHAAVLSNGYFSDIGIGMAEGKINGQNATVVVAFLGRKLPPSAAMEVQNDQSQEVASIPEAQAREVFSLQDVAPYEPIVVERGSREGKTIALTANPSLIRPSLEQPERSMHLLSFASPPEASRNGFSFFYLGLIGWTAVVAVLQHRDWRFYVPRVAGLFGFALVLWLGSILQFLL